MADLREICWYCRNFHGGGLARGECRRGSPRVLFSRHSEEIGSVWPVVSANDWCGEHRPARKVSQED